MFALLAAFMFVALGQNNPPVAQVVLVIERSTAGRYAYTCNGKPLDPKRIATGVEAVLPENANETAMFVLMDDRVSFMELYRVASLLEGHMGLRHVRYSTFSRKTRMMQEVTPKWDLWRLSFDGKLERALR